MLTTLDFHLRPAEAGRYHLQVFERGSSQPLAQAAFALELSFLTDYEVRQLDSDLRDPQGRLERLTAFGRKLYTILFTPELQRLWQDYKHQAAFLELCLRIDPAARGLETLPWETLFDGEEFLAAGVKTGLSRLPLEVKLRDRLDPVPAPCRMLAFISSPLDLKDTERLNLEAEQEMLLRAVNTPAGQGKLELVCEDEARLPILENSLGEGYQLLHYSGHGIPPEGGGGLLLEDASGHSRPTPVSEILPVLHKGEGDLRLVVLSGCQTARTLNSGGFRDLARGLLQQGLPAVIAMQFSLTDAGGRRFAEHLYPRLLEGQALPLAVSAGRRALLADDHPQVKADAFAPVLLAAHPQPLELSMPSAAAATATPVLDFSFHLPLPQLQAGFYGRRKEYRALRDGLIYKQQRAVLIHGIGGIGKTTLATQAATRLKKHFRGVYGFNCAGGVLAPETIVLELHRYLERQNIQALQPLLHQALPPGELAGYLAQVLSQWPLLLLFDNFETHLTQTAGGPHTIADPSLREFLTTLIQATATGSRFVFTSLHLFEVEARRVGPVQAIPLHDLSRPEALGLMQHLPNLAPAAYEDKLQAFQTFGGHPYALVTLDRHCGLKPLAQVFQDAAYLKTELREFLALELSYKSLSAEAKTLLNRLAAFRQPVSPEAAVWMLGEPVRLSRDFLKKLDRDQMPPEMQALDEAELLELFQKHLPEERRAVNLDPFIAELVGWGLLTPLEEGGQRRHLAVHCLVRDFCQEKQARETWRHHLREAAAYYTNQTKLLSQDAKTPEAVGLELEALELLLEAGDFEKAASLLIEVNLLLNRWGLGRLCESLTRRLLPQVNIEQQGILLLHLGILYYIRSDYEAALKNYEKSLKIVKELGDRDGMAACLHQIGGIQQERGEYAVALKNYEKSLKIMEERGNRSGVAKSLGQIGIIQLIRGDYAAALGNFEKTLKIAEELGDWDDVAASLHHIGIIIEMRGDYEAALINYEKSLKIKEELGDRGGMARSLIHIGIIQQVRGDHAAALENCEKALKIFEERGDRGDMAKSLHQIGIIQQERGEDVVALENFEKTLKIFEELGDRGGMARSLQNIGIIQKKLKDYEAALENCEKALKIAEQLGDRRVVGASLHQIGITQQERGEYAVALENYEKALKIFEELGDRLGQATTGWAVGQVLLKTQKYPEALEGFLLAFSLCAELQSPKINGILEDLRQLRAAWGAEPFDPAWQAKMGTGVPDFLQ
jgi:tetratricopeptide (TPR) repeat protein